MTQNNLPQAELLQAVLDRAGITHWDLLLVGDGSGNQWNLPSGWASILVHRWHGIRPLFFGAMNSGSINLAEMMPYLQALTWYDKHAGHAEIKTSGPRNVHIITDSRVIATHGTTAADFKQPLPACSQRALWAAMREFGFMGYRITWHWAARSSNSLNFLADLIAGMARREIDLLAKKAATTSYASLAARAAEALASVGFVDPASSELLDINALNPFNGT